MSLYFFRISTGRYSGAADHPYEFEDRAAEQTAKATDEIGQQIASIQTATEHSVGAIQRGARAFGRAIAVAGSTRLKSEGARFLESVRAA